jgi:hypothetical protein
MKTATALWNGWLLAGGLAGAAVAFAQQVPDPNFPVKVATPAYTANHPHVLFDEAHFNVHTTKGSYQSFAELVTNDGYQVTPNEKPFDAKTLAGADILVIANARGAARPSELPAFTEPECDAVRDWIRAGGNLLLVVDHYPTGHAVDSLARRLGVNLSKGTTTDPDHAAPGAGGMGTLLFARTNQLIADHAITLGRNEAERVNRVITFTGQSLKGPEGSVAFLELADTAVDRLPSAGTPGQVAARPQARRPGPGAAAAGQSVSAAGRAQGVALAFGKGRVVVLGEASQLSAQLAGPQQRPMGMNFPGIDNRQMALNIMHWLSHLID